MHVTESGGTVAGDVAKLNLTLTTTGEDPSAFIAANGIRPVDDYDAMRFVRFAEALAQASGPLRLLDADALAPRDPLSIFDIDADIIRAHMRTPFWGLDQYALHSAFVGTVPAIRLLGPEWADVVHGEGGVFWFTAGKDKTRLKTGETPYARPFRRYWGQSA